jgi:endo-1,4-beta-xylanase
MERSTAKQISAKSAQKETGLRGYFSQALLFVFGLCLLAVAGAFAKGESHPDQLIDDSAWKIICPRDRGTCRSLNFADSFEFDLKRPQHPQDVQMTQPIKGKLKRGALIKLSFEAKTETPHNIIHIVYQLSNPPYTKVWEKELLLLSQDPPKHYFDEAIPANAPGQYSLSFLLGKCSGRVALDDVSMRVKNLVAREDPALAAVLASIKPDRVEERIRAVRAGIITVKVRDQAGRPIPNVKVEIKQLRHQFLFGCSLGGLKLDDHSEFQRNYQKRFFDLFNYATLPCDWDSIEPTPGNYDFKRLDEMAKWCAEHHIKTKGHTFIEEWSDPHWLQKEPAKAVPLAREMVTNCLKHMGKSVPTWDVTSDVIGALDSDEHTYLALWLKQEQKRRTTFSEEVAKTRATTEVVGSALLWAKAAASGSDQTYIVSDSNSGDESEKMYAVLEQKENLPGGIGISSQMFQSKKRWGFDQLYGVSNRFAKFAPIHWTSVMVQSGDDKAKIDWDKPYTDWLSTTRGEADQADYVVQMYRVLFSNPNVASISWADLSDKGQWLGAPGGLLRRNGTAKPAYNKLMDLIHKEWWTHIQPGVTGQNGNFRAEPLFFGDYDIAVTDKNGLVIHRQLQFRYSQDLVVTL